VRCYFCEFHPKIQRQILNNSAQDSQVLSSEQGVHFSSSRAEQLIQPDASIASLSSLSLEIVLNALCSARVNSGVRFLLVMDYFTYEETMRPTLCLMTFLALIALSVVVSLAHDPKPQRISNSQRQSQKTSDEDKVYKPKEVTQKAIIKLRPEVQLNPISIEGCTKQGTAVVSMILHKSGKVKGVKLIHGMSCGFDKLALEAASKIKFIPAMKDGVAVSQYLMVEYGYMQH
jgi:TonB family protein